MSSDAWPGFLSRLFYERYNTMHTKVFKTLIAIFIIAAIVCVVCANVGKHKANADEQSGWTQCINYGRGPVFIYEWISPDEVSYWILYEANHGNIAMYPRYNN